MSRRAWAPRSAASPSALERPAVSAVAADRPARLPRERPISVAPRAVGVHAPPRRRRVRVAFVGRTRIVALLRRARRLHASRASPWPRCVSRVASTWRGARVGPKRARASASRSPSASPVRARARPLGARACARALAPREPLRRRRLGPLMASVYVHVLGVCFGRLPQRVHRGARQTVVALGGQLRHTSRHPRSPLRSFSSLVSSLLPPLASPLLPSPLPSIVSLLCVPLLLASHSLSQPFLLSSSLPALRSVQFSPHPFPAVRSSLGVSSPLVSSLIYCLLSSLFSVLSSPLASPLLSPRFFSSPLLPSSLAVSSLWFGIHDFRGRMCYRTDFQFEQISPCDRTILSYTFQLMSLVVSLLSSALTCMVSFTCSRSRSLLLLLFSVICYLSSSLSFHASTVEFDEVWPRRHGASRRSSLCYSQCSSGPCFKLRLL